MRAVGWLLATLLCVPTATLPAYAQDETTLVRGTINYARDGGMIGLVMEVLTTDQQTVHIYLDNAFKVVQIDSVPADDIEIGTRAALPSSGDQASVVWSLSEGDLPLDQLPWRLPGGTELAAGEVISRSDDAITISTPESELTATIGAETVIIATTAETSTMGRLIEGTSVVIIAERGQDGTLSTDRIYISSTAPLPL